MTASQNKFGALLLLGCLAAVWPSPALAAEGDAKKAEGSDTPSEAAEAAEPVEDGEPKADPAEGEKPKSKADAVPEDPGSPIEDPNKTYHFVGLRYRHIIVPQFILGLFASGGTTVSVPSIGPEFAIRKGGFEYNLSVWYANYGMALTKFKAKNDPPEAWEMVESKLHAVYLSADFLWSHEFSPEFALNYGMGAGLGVIFGNLYRTQARPKTADVNGEYESCPGVEQPGSPTARFCSNDNNHYNGYTEPSLVNGGSVPPVFPWLSIQTGLRYKPHHNFVARLDAGFGLSGFFLGVGADYGL